MEAGAELRGGARRGAAARATRRPIRPRTSPAPTPRRRWRSSRPSRSARGSTLADVDVRGDRGDHGRSTSTAARELDTVVRLVGAATLVGGTVDVRVGPALVDRHHPLAAVEGAFNAVMLQGDAIREITLEGPGAGGIETASAVVADMVSVIGTTGTGFLQNDACWRQLERLPAGELRSPFYVRIEVDDRPGVLAHVAERLAAHEVSIARLIQHPGRRRRARHRHARGRRRRAWRPRSADVASLAEVRGRARGAARHLRPRRLVCKLVDDSSRRALSRPPAAHRCDAARLARRGLDAAPRGAAALGAARARALAQVGGREPDRVASRIAA